jgi:hypothetical protein
MTSILKDLEDLLKEKKFIGKNGSMVFIMHSDGSGFLMSRCMQSGKIFESKIWEFQSPRQFFKNANEALRLGATV